MPFLPTNQQLDKLGSSNCILLEMVYNFCYINNHDRHKYRMSFDSNDNNQKSMPMLTEKQFLLKVIHIFMHQTFYNSRERWN